MNIKIPHAVTGSLSEYLRGIPKAAIAFSGGVDSSYLLYAAIKSSVDVCAYYVNSQFQPQFELDDAKRLTHELGASMKVINLDVLAHSQVASNPADRCYHCKRAIFETLIEAAAADGYCVLMDGSNASDDDADRPGMRALAELKVLSPLRDTQLTKPEIRELSREAGLFTWDKPAYACLATRVPTGVMLDSQILGKIEKAEAALSAMGFTDFRARVLGCSAKLEFPAEQILLAAQHRNEILKTLSPWFTDILLDLKPR